MTANQIQNALVASTILGFAVMELVSRRYKQNVNASANDTKLELLMFLSLLAITQPLAILVTSQLGVDFFPQYKDTLSDMPWWAMVGLLLLLDDLTQYWWHRVSHSPLLWPLHRTFELPLKAEVRKKNSLGVGSVTLCEIELLGF